LYMECKEGSNNEENLQTSFRKLPLRKFQGCDRVRAFKIWDCLSEASFPNWKPIRVFDAMKYILVIRSLSCSLSIKHGRQSSPSRNFRWGALLWVTFLGRQER
jgi:hypothetical protein